MDNSDKIRVFLLDDHEIVRRGLQDLLEAEGDIEVAGEAGSAAEALRRVPAVCPDVAVLDVRLEDGDGVTVCRDLMSEMPGLNVLMLTSFSDDEALLGAVLATLKAMSSNNSAAPSSSTPSAAWPPAKPSSTPAPPPRSPNASNSAPPPTLWPT